MKIFLDTSTLFKLYHKGTGTEEIERIFSSARISHVFLSEISKIEFSSTIWKKQQISF
jgi:PIN domain nuclease of toxin-antitoxin system